MQPAELKDPERFTDKCVVQPFLIAHLSLWSYTMIESPRYENVYFRASLMLPGSTSLFHLGKHHLGGAFVEGGDE